MPITNNFVPAVDGANYVPNTYSSLDDMIGKIAHQIIKEVDTKDPLAVFDKVPVDNGDTIEQSIVKLVDASAYDPTGAGALTRETAVSVAVRYFNNWQRHTYKKTIDYSMIRKVMTTGRGAEEVADKIVSAMSNSRIHDKFKSLVALLQWGRTVGSYDPSTAVIQSSTTIAAGSDGRIDAKAILRALKNTVKGFTFVGTDYNVPQLKQSTPLDNIYIVMSYKMKNALDIDELAGVFNLEKTEIGARIIEIDDDDEYIYVLDERAILDYTRLNEMVSQINADGLFYNYFLHIEDLFAISPLFNTYCIVTAGTIE